MNEMEELKQEFLHEAQELLNSMEEGILALESNPEHADAIDEIFRVAHTLKGGAASLDLIRIAEFTHALEDLFDKVREGQLKINDKMIDIILNSLDVLKVMVDAAARTEEPQPGIEEETLKKIRDVQSGIVMEKPQKKKFSYPTPPVKMEEELDFDAISQIDLKKYDLERIQEGRASGKNVFQIFILLNANYEMRSVSGLQIYTSLKEAGEIIASEPLLDTILEEDFIPEMEFILMSGLSKQELYSKIFFSDVTDKVNIELYKAPDEDSDQDYSQTQPEACELILDKKVKENITKNLEQGANVFRVSLEIEKDNPMRNVDSLLMYNTLEEMGTILVANPQKQQLTQDEFYPCLNMIIATKENKDFLKEKCTINGTTKNVKVATFKSKDEQSGQAGQEVSQSKNPSFAPGRDKSEEISREPGQAAGGAKGAQKTFLRVESARVDTLMNLVSELVISKAGLVETTGQILSIMDMLQGSGAETKKNFSELYGEVRVNDQAKYNQIQEFFNIVSRSSWGELDNFEKIINIISRVINELQESVMKIRMVPISNIFNRFPRIVRDLTKNLKKQVDIEMFGEDTELDKSVIEQLLDPLVHMIRNAIDHGIEMPAERRREGKSEMGKVILGASHEGSMIKIEIGDDGKGLDALRIRQKAIEKGLIPENKELSKEEALALIFKPGFSTASEVTELSGRGVGMDVVKRRIEDLSGSIFVETEKNKGTKFIIKIPLTLAIIQALIVEINSNSYSIPINNIVETLSISQDQIEVFEGNPVIRLRDEMITVVNLRDIFNLREERKTKKSEEKELEEDLLSGSDEKYVIVVNVSNKKAGFLVDKVAAEQDIVIKPLHKKYAMTKGISGATILGDGRISLIIDTYQLIDMFINKEKYISIR